MRKTKKYLIAFLFTLLCVTLFAFVGCSSRGKQGEKGQDGLNGKSAYEIWIDNGHFGSESDFLEWLKGTNGKDGTNGQDGQNGLKGDTGETGPKGDTGPAGPQGPQGEKGNDGQNGTNGLSAFEIWIKNGHSGSENDFLDWLKSQNGTQGPQGEKGDTGPAGPQGEKGDKGDQGETGATGPQGPKGDKGDTGNDGQDGTNGLSAYEIFLKYYPYYTGTEEQWINELAMGKIKIHTVTFKSDRNDDIIKYVLDGYKLLDIPEVPEKAGNIGIWDNENFDNISSNLVVNAIYQSINLYYKEINDGTEYEVRGPYYDTLEEIYIPAEYNGKPVTQIAPDAFRNAWNTKYISIPNSVTTIGSQAFLYCGFTSVTIPSSVTYINGSAFRNCSHLERIDVDENNTKYSSQDGVLYNKEKTEIRWVSETIEGEFVIQDGVTDIAYSAFECCNKLTNIAIPNGVTYIGECAFRYCTELTNIVLPNTVTWIDSDTFQACNNLTNVYFEGTQSELDSFIISNITNCSPNATIYYFSETTPTDDGNYWHYDIDEKTPVVWSNE